jgi:hypothetical protein
LVIALLAVFWSAPTSAELTIELKDYAAMPVTGSFEDAGQTGGMLSRVNTVREEPGGHLPPGARRLFVNDLNGPLYILDKETRQFTPYLDFNGREGHTGIFHRLIYETGYGNGLAHFEFDPDYARNGKFYTVHIENPAIAASNLPDNSHVPGLNVSGYTTTAPIVTPGPALLEAVLIEWTDTNTANTTFEGTSREVMRVQLNTRIHPMGEISFNPTARPGDPEWRVAYIGCGDSGSGEEKGEVRQNPQRLDTLVGKILRIIPDSGEHQETSTVSDNGRYRIPIDNPFVSTPGARKEIWAYGLRNPHRLSWAIDPANPANNRLIATSIGLHEVDKIPVQIGGTVTDQVVVPTYPVIQYGHVPGGGDAIGSGYLYGGKAIPALRGKYIFTDLSTGRIWYADYKDMLAADDGDPKTMAPIHEVKILWNGQAYDSMFPIAEAAYHARGGKAPHLPGRGKVSGPGRADARMSIDQAGEIYIYSKTDGVIRQIVGAR